MKTADLIGAQLDYWVTRAEGQVPQDAFAIYSTWRAPRYSTDWVQGGPIIERESVSVGKRVDMPPGPRQWDAFIDSTFAPQGLSPHVWWGPTPLIAAMRAYVASKFGAEVPDDPALP